MSQKRKNSDFADFEMNELLFRKGSGVMVTVNTKQKIQLTSRDLAVIIDVLSRSSLEMCYGMSQSRHFDEPFVVLMLVSGAYAGAILVYESNMIGEFWQR